MAKQLEDITKQDFEDYERVRAEGHWNMWSSEAQLASGLDKDTYYAVMQHYGILAERYPGVRRG